MVMLGNSKMARHANQRPHLSTSRATYSNRYYSKQLHVSKPIYISILGACHLASLNLLSFQNTTLYHNAASTRKHLLGNSVSKTNLSKYVDFCNCPSYNIYAECFWRDAAWLISMWCGENEELNGVARQPSDHSYFTLSMDSRLAANGAPSFQWESFGHHRWEGCLFPLSILRVQP